MVRAPLGAWNREHGTHSGGGSALLKCHLGRCALGLCGFEQRRLLEAEHAGHLDGREDLAPDVVVGGGVVERLPGEADLVLGRGQLLLQGEHVWLALRSGYASDRAKSRPRVPPSWTSAWLSFSMVAGSLGLAAT